MLVQHQLLSVKKVLSTTKIPESAWTLMNAPPVKMTVINQICFASTRWALTVVLAARLALHLMNNLPSVEM